MIFDKLFRPNNAQTQYAKFLNNTTPLFSQFGRNIYASDVVQMCIDCIASECSKLQPRHIRRSNDGPITVNDSLNNLFKFQPNPMMTTRDFLEKTVWNLFLNYNAFIYPVYDIVTDARGNASRNYTAFYPLNPTLAEFLQDTAGTLYVRFTFQNGYPSPAIPYSQIIHLRKKFSCNDVMGGGISGQPDNDALIKTLEINDTVLQGIGKMIGTSLSVRGVVKYNTRLDDGHQASEIKAFEQKLGDSKSGILPMDLSADFTPINFNPATIDQTTLDFLKNNVLNWYGVSIPILTGDYSDNQKQAFYDKAIEPVVVGMKQAFTSTIFTPTEISYGNEMAFYYHNLEMMSIESKKAIADTLGNRGALTNNFLLSMFGIEPYEGGNVRIASLNYANVNIVDQYQLARAGIDAQIPNNQNIGGSKDGKAE